MNMSLTMAKNRFKHFDIQMAKKAYANGENITELLRRQKNVDHNTPEIIEVAYDLQAGTYIEHVENNFEDTVAYAAELAGILDSYISSDKSVLDIGSGELTTLSLVARSLRRKPKNIYAFDISWSRVYKGLDFARKHMGSDSERLVPFVADISETPLSSKSISITTSSHALEPNGGNLPTLLAELFRVTVDKLILFEPCYEINSDEGKLRMDRLGFIKGVDAEVEKLGGKVEKKIVIRNTKNISHPLNPTVCFVISPPPSTIAPFFVHADAREIFAVPGTDMRLKKVDDFYYSKAAGICFPILKSIPVLRPNSGILASALDDFNAGSV